MDLFPKPGGGGPPSLVDVHWTDDLRVMEANMTQTRKRLRAKSKTSGLNGIFGRAWALTLDR